MCYSLNNRRRGEERRWGVVEGWERPMLRVKKEGTCTKLVYNQKKNPVLEEGGAVGVVVWGGKEVVGECPTIE